jgi:hypothetical protein
MRTLLTLLYAAVTILTTEAFVPLSRFGVVQVSFLFRFFSSFASSLEKDPMRCLSSSSYSNDE